MKKIKIERPKKENINSEQINKIINEIRKERLDKFLNDESYRNEIIEICFKEDLF